jgi:Peptidase family S41
MRRKIIHNRVVKQRMEPGNIGYVRLTEFTEQADAGVRRAIRSLRSQVGGKLRALILDLRNNPGVLLGQAVAVSGEFIGRGEIVSTHGRADGDAEWFDARGGMPPAAIEAHLSVIGNPQAMEAALAWYRACGVRHVPVGPIRVPHLGRSGRHRGTCGCRRDRQFIAVPYQFGVLSGVGHYAADQVTERVNALLLEHLARHSLIIAGW